MERIFQDPTDYNAAQVEISVRGRETGMEGYDEKLLTLKRGVVTKTPPLHHGCASG